MALTVNNNIAAVNAYRNLSVSSNSVAKSLEKLSSGFRINRAGDDASGLVISEALRSQVGGLNQAARNAQDGISVVQTAEGALSETTSMLQRMRDLTVQAGNGSNSTESVAASQAEVTELAKSIDDIASRTKFNGVALLNSTSTLTFQVGANGSETLDVATANMSATGLGLGASGVTVGGTGTAAALGLIDTAIGKVSTFRGSLGATQNRLEHTINNLNVTSENLTASESRIRDTDMAKEMTNFSKSQILVQAGTAMLAQANSAPQGILSLLRG